MSIQTLINYLRFTRRSEEAEAKSKQHLAIVIDKNYEPNGPFHEENLVQVSKTDIQSQNNYKNIRHLIPDELYFVEVAQNQYKYYIKREQIINGNTVIEYSQITTIITNVWETLVNQTVHKITFNVVPNLYYSEVSNTIMEVYLEGIVVFSDTFKYHPDDISEVTNGEYILDFKDADGFTNLGIDYFLKRLANSNNEILKTEKRRTVNFIKNTRPGIITSFPRITQQGNKYILQYNYYAKGIPAQSFLVDNALCLEFTYIGAMMAVLNETIFYTLTEKSDFEGHKHRDPFLTAYLDLIEDRIYYASLTEALEILFFAPAFAIQELRTDFLWHLIDNTLNSSLTNFQGIDKEDIVLKVIEVLAQKENLKEKILQQLLAKHPSGKTRLEMLYDKIDGENNQKFVKLIYGLWKKSKYTMPDEKQNKEFVTTTGPLFLPYESEKWLGLYFSNASTSFKDGMIKVDFETGKSQDVRRPNPKGGGYYTTKEEIIEQYDYHPYYPIFIKNIEKQETTLELDAIVPAFLLFANQNKQFWHNVIKTGEYTLDAVTTLSGIGNLAKFRYLTRLAKLAEGVETANTIAKTANILRYVKGAAGVVELTSGSVNLMLKLTEADETELGQSISKVLFYLELITLTGELTTSMKHGLQKSAKEAVESSNGAMRGKHPELFAELYKISGMKKVYQHIDDFMKTRPKFNDLDLVNKLWKEKIVSKLLYPTNLRKLYFKYLDEFPNLQKGFNQAEFKTTILNQGKKVDEIVEFSLSGRKSRLLDEFGNPPDLPENTIDILSDYDNFEVFVKGASDFSGAPRNYDSEIKYIFNFLKNHINKGDEFIIETQNIFKTCGSCRREFIMLEDYLKLQGKKVKFVVFSDETIEGTAHLKKKLKIKQQ